MLPSSVNSEELIEVVYLPEMRESNAELTRRITALEKADDKAELRHEKLTEKLQDLRNQLHEVETDRIVPTEAKVNQLHGLGK